MDVLPSQLKNRRFGDELLGTLAANAFPPDRFEVEVAESTIVQDLDIARRALGPLRQSGVTITLDNFGTGYSNLYHMRELQIDKVKIARRLIEDDGDADGERFVRALAGFGHGLGLQVCADGLSDARSSARAGVSQGQEGGGSTGAEKARRLAGQITDAGTAKKCTR